MKKIIAIFLSAAMLLCLLAGCASETEGQGQEDPAPSGDEDDLQTQEPAGTDEVTFEPTKIGYATVGIDEAFVRTQNYFNDVVGPLLNIEFMFSEAITDAGAMTTFIENAYAAGCSAIFTDSTANLDQAAAVCNDLGMYFVGVSSGDITENSAMPYYASVVGSAAAGYGESNAEAIKSVATEDEPLNTIILSAAACYGATSFIEATVGCLQGLQEVYGLTYTEDVYDLATSNVVTNAENDKGLTITIVPGLDATIVDTVSPMLQSGEYDLVVGTAGFYETLGVAVDEVEKATGKDIHFIDRSGVTESMSDIFNSVDSTGNQTLDAVIDAGAFERLAGIIVLRNCIDGYADNMRDGDQCSRITGMRPFVVTTTEEFNKLASEDIPNGFCTNEDILSLTCKVNPDITFKDIDEFGASLTTDTIMEKFA